MSDTEPQTAGGKVLWHFTMSLDGFVAGPNHEMDWMTGVSFRPGLVKEYVETTGAVLYDAAGRVVSVVELDVAEGVVQAIRAVVNPDKLGHIGPVSDVARRPEKEAAVGAHEVGDAGV